MSNKISIRQVETRSKGEESFRKSVEIFNDNAFSSIGFESIGFETDSKFFDCIDELLKYLVEAYKNNDGDNAFMDIMDNIYSCERDFYIDGTLYEWDEIKKNFENMLG